MPQRQDEARIRQLLKQFPFLVDTYRQETSERTVATTGRVFPVIRVQRGDADLMFRRADNVDGNGRYIAEPGTSTLEGTRYEYYCPVNGQGQVGNIRHWLDRETQFVRDLFDHDIYDWATENGGHGQDPTEVVDSLFWVTRKVWYPAGTRHTGPFLIPSASAVRTDLHITVYQKPDIGWRELYRTADPLVNVNLYGSTLFPGSSYNDPYNRAITDRLHGLAMEFQDKVWMTGLGTIVDTSRARGMSGQYGNVTVLTYIIAGRLRVQFEQGNAHFTLAGLEEPNPRLGFGSIAGTVQQAEQMVRGVIAFWEGADEATRQTVHQDNTSVSVM